jgi:hypothetical protein
MNSQLNSSPLTIATVFFHGLLLKCTQFRLFKFEERQSSHSLFNESIFFLLILKHILEIHFHTWGHAVA